MSPAPATYLTPDGNGGYELDPAVTFATCARLIILPVLENGDYSGGTTSGTVVGFIPFYLALWCNSSHCTHPVSGDPEGLERHDFWGYFVRLDLTSLTYSDYRPEFGTQVVALVG